MILLKERLISKEYIPQVKTFSSRPNLINTSRNGWKQAGAELGQAQFLLYSDETDVKVIVGVSY